jgi:NAD(P)-dependent dehydrogenase (short-subunit alcohol dehydrogenase family)
VSAAANRSGPGRLAGKTALITGGAGSIGVASARALVEGGAEVMLADLDEDALTAAAAAIEGESSTATVAWRVCDVTVEEQVAAAVRATVDRFGALDIAFANAGIAGAPFPLTEFPVDVFEQVLRVNVIGSMLVCKHALGAISDGGSLIINSSVTGLIGIPNIAAYVTSKHALVGLMRTAAKEMAGRRVRVNSLHPGPVDNDFQHAIEMAETGHPSEQATEIFDSMIPLGRHASPAEVAAAVVYLASDESAFMTGHTFALDGGLSG